MSNQEEEGGQGQGDEQAIPGQAPEIPAGAGGEEDAPLQAQVQELVAMLDTSEEADDPVPDVQQLLNLAAAPDLLPFPGVDRRCFDLWFTVKRRLMGIVYEGDQLLWRRSRYGVIDEEILSCMYGNYRLVVRLIQALPTYARSFHANMDAIASMDRLVTAQQDILENLLDQEPVYGAYGDSSEEYDE